MIILKKGECTSIKHILLLEVINRSYSSATKSVYRLDKTKQYYVQLRYKFDSLDAQKYLGQATIDSLERATGAKLFYGELKSNKVPLVQD